MLVKWTVGSRNPIELEIDDEELSECNSDEERDNWIYDAVMMDFQDKMGVNWQIVENYKPTP